MYFVDVGMYMCCFINVACAPDVCDAYGVEYACVQVLLCMYVCMCMCVPVFVQ